jgi:hypothetical protein
VGEWESESESESEGERLESVYRRERWEEGGRGGGVVVGGGRGSERESDREESPGESLKWGIRQTER